MFTNVFRTAYVLRNPPYAQLIPPHDRKTIARLFGSGALTFLTGFLVWNLDNIFCARLTMWKHLMGWPGAFLLEGHSWWHILTVRVSSASSMDILANGFMLFRQLERT